MIQKVRVSELADHGDQRGYSFTVPSGVVEFLGRIMDIHVASIMPGSIRGNHFHLRRREALIIVHESDWSLHWDEGQNTATASTEYSGTGTKVVLIEPGASHAVRNSGTKVLSLLALSSEVYDPAESVPRKVI